MKLSIITINYNNAQGLKNTIQSIIAQNFSDFEYLVIDGHSTDGSKNIIEQNQDKINYWVSEPDTGVYNAMNKGIKQAKGEYLLFINSGDTLYNNMVLSDIFASDPTTDLVYGNLQRIYPDGHSDSVEMPDHISLQHMLGDTLAHPVTLIKRKLFEKYGFYREDLKIVSDWAFFLKIIAFGRISQSHIPLTVASFMMDGISNDPKYKNLITKETKQVFEESFSPELLQLCTDYPILHGFYNKKSITTLRYLIALIRKLTSVSGWKNILNKIYRSFPSWLLSATNSTVRKQRKDPLSIPIIIINYNRLADLKKLIKFLLDRKHKNIVIVDNTSTYTPLLEYYEHIKDKVTIEFMDQNYGHLVFWNNADLNKKYSSGYHIITDSDILPNENLPSDYLHTMISKLHKYTNVTKVGFALQINDIPDSFAPKETVIDWEKQFWENEIEKDIYKAALDTTFALYYPNYKIKIPAFYRGVRLAGNFMARHEGWYVDSKNMTEEEKFYYRTANASSSWKLDEEGKFDGQSELYKK